MRNLQVMPRFLIFKGGSKLERCSFNFVCFIREDKVDTLTHNLCSLCVENHKISITLARFEHNDQK